ncbi:MAG: hypothetical protein WCN97_01125 [Thermoleophilia bacterium]
MRRRSAWLVSLPLVVLGSLLAHQLAYLIVAGHHADALLAETGHGYLEQLPTAAVLGLSCLALGLGLAGFDYVRGARGKAIPAWLIALVPLVGFTLQEHIERLAHNGHMPWAAALDATFLVGLGLQLPFAAFAFVAARALLRTVVAVVEALLGSRQAPTRHRTINRRAPRARVSLGTGIARSLAPRGPPATPFV